MSESTRFLRWIRPLLALCLLTVLGCRGGFFARGGEPTVQPIGMDVSTASAIRVLKPAFLLDPQLSVFDAAAPAWLFDGHGGSLIPGTGWTPVSTDGGFFSFVEGEKAELRFPSPDNPDLGLFCRVRGVPSEDGKLQKMTIVLNGYALDPIELASTVTDYRIKLPEGHLRDGVNTIELQFAHTKASPDDPRLVAAAFYALSVLPNHIPDPFGFIHEGGLDPSSTRLRVADGEKIVLPVAPHHQFTLECGNVQGSVEGLEVVVEVSTGATGGKWGELWRGAPEKLSGQRLTATNSWAKIGKMRIFVHSPSTGLAIPGAFVDISLGDNALMDSPWQPEKFEEWMKKKNVFVYLVDALRADRLGVYGGNRNLTPNLDAFASDSTRFSKAESSSSWTLPAVASILTGYPPVFHQMMTGNIRMGWDQLDPVGLRLRDEGLLSLGISQSYVVGPAFGFDQAFGDFIANTQLSGRELRTDDLRGFLRHELLDNGSFSTPVFAYLHTVGTHAPYTPSPEYLKKWVEEFPGKLGDEDYLPSEFSSKNYGSDPAELAHIKALYDAEAAYEDAAFGRFIDLLKFLGVYDSSMIVFLSDHGEEFSDHGGFDHGMTLYEELTHVPLIIHFPKSMTAPKRVDRRISTAQIPATIGEVLGLSWSEPKSTASSLLQLPAETGQGNDQTLFAEVHQAGSSGEGAIAYNAVWNNDQKCLFSPGGVDQFGMKEPYLRLFDLSVDPGENHPEVFEDGSDLACWKELRTWSDQWVGRRDQVLGKAGVSIDQKVRDQMKALGYLQ